MTNKLKKIIASVLTAALLIGCVPVSHAARYDTITINNSYINKLTYSGVASLTVNNGVYNTGGKSYTAKTFALQASPYHVSIGVANGDYIYGKNTVSEMTSKYNKGDLKVIGAINGDFFDTVTGFPLGLQIDGGKIYATNSANDASDGDIVKGRTTIGFKADGSVVFGVPEIELSANIDGYEFGITRVNSYPNYVIEWGWQPVILLTPDYGEKTYWTMGKAYDIIVLDADSDLHIGDDTTCHFSAYLQNVTDPITIEDDKFYIVAPAGYYVGFEPPQPTELPSPEDIANGAIPEINDITYVSVREKTGKWNDVVSAVCAGNMLINNSQICPPSTYDSAIKNSITSRSAFGVKADGNYVFYVAERNNSAGTAGLRMDAVAQAMLDMGCVYAVNLDGGGSTTLLADEGSGLRLQNRVQDGSQRKVSNAIMIMSRETAPKVIEDFEADKSLTEVYEGTNVMTASVDDKNAYTGDKALAIEYSLGGVGSAVSVEFEPIDIKNYDMLSVAADVHGKSVTVEARLKNDKGVFTRPLETKQGSYSHSELNVSDAEQLVGFTVKCKLASRERGTVYIDRIAAWRGYSVKDTTPPTLSLTTSGNKLTVSALKNAYTAPVDANGTEIRINGGQVIRANTADLSTAPADRINRVRVDSVDVFGNRSAKYSLFKTAEYNKPLPFVDMQDGKWDSLFIRYCYENGIINGFSENGQLLYKGSDNITRAQFCLMIVSQKKLNVNNYLNITLPYEDVADIPAWALPYIRAAYAEGIMTGSKTATGVKFYPNNDITRAEAASALDRLMTKDTRISTVVKYKDENDIGTWARAAVAEVSTQGLFEGDKDGNFYPNRNLTRSESAVLMSKL